VDEASTVASISGYTGPVSSPEDPEDFYSAAAQAVGGSYVSDPMEIQKQARKWQKGNA
jgi:hypothetical protein